MVFRSRVFFASVLGLIWITIYDCIARAFSDKSLEVSVSGAATTFGVALLIGAAVGAVVWILIAAASANGPARSISIGTVERLSQAPWWVVMAAIMALSAPIAGVIPLRAKLLERTSSMAVAVDLAALTLAWAMVVVVSRLFGTRGGWRISRCAAGWGCLIVALAAAGAFLSARPYLISADVWSLVLIGDWTIFAIGIALIIPKVVLTKIAVACVAAAAFVGGAASTFALQKSEAIRDEVAIDWSPANWFVSIVTSTVDFDRDGFSPVFGGGDCDDHNELVNPEGIEIAGNGVDENCRDGDKSAKLPWPERPVFVPLPEGVKEPRSIILIVVDALRKDHLGVYGYQRPTSPRIDALASKSTVFTRAYSSAPTTRIAIPMLQTGKYLSEIPWNRQLFPYGLKDSAVTLAEILKKERGFTSVSFVTHRFLGKKWGWMQGFDEVNEDFVLPRAEYENAATGAGLSAKVAEWIEAHKDERFYAYVHFLDTHQKYLKHKDGPDFGDGLIDRYDSEVWYSDKAVGVILDKIEELGLGDDTLVIVMADHGEYLGEHGKKSHGGSMYEVGVQIPLIIRAPGFAAAQADCVTGHIDLTPTVLNLFGIDAGKYQMSGASLVPDMMKSGCAYERETVLEIRYGRLGGSNLRALIGKRWKIVADIRKGRYDLFDLENEPEENKSLVSKYPDEFKKTKRRLLAWTDIYANREQLEIMRDLVSDEPPKNTEQVFARFENGIELVAVDFEKRALIGQEEPAYQLYFRARERERRDCMIHFYLVDGDGDTRFDTKHPPIAGTFPFEKWPIGKVVEDGFAFELFNSLMIGGNLEDGQYEARVGITCGRDLVRATKGDVDSEGRARVGVIEIDRKGENSKGDDE